MNSAASPLRRFFSKHFAGLPDETEFSAESPCFGSQSFADLLVDYGIGDGRSARVAAAEFRLVLLTKAACLTKNADETMEAADLSWALEELLKALEIREELLLMA